MSISSDKCDKTLKELLLKRSSAKGQITKFKNYLEDISNKNELNNLEITELRLKLAKFEALSMRVDDLQNEIELKNPSNIDLEIEERDKIEHDIIINIALAKTLLERFSSVFEAEQRRHSLLETSCCTLDHSEVNLRLPQIQISKFDGAYFRWLEFRDTFESLIHKNSKLSDIHKFHYLNSYLEGEAARIIYNLEVSSANYLQAWDLICNRYNNKRILINQHLSALFSIKPLPRESEKSLRFLVDHVTKNLRALSSLGQPTDKWDVLIIFMLCSKLDSNTLTKWEECRSSLNSDVPTLEQFFKFITDRADVLESLVRNKSESTSSRIVQNSNNMRSNHNYQLNSNCTKSFASSSTKSNKVTTFSCIICNENHKIYDCPTFKSMGMEDKLSEVSKYKLCSNCLRQGHPVNECRMGPCRQCNKRHNTLLHHSESAINSNVSTNMSSQSSVNFAKQSTGQVLLSTAIIEVVNPLTQQKDKVRALLDCGSQSSFISKSLKDKITLKSYPIDSLKVIGIGNHASSNVIESCNLQINSLNSKFTVNLSCLVLNELTGDLPKDPIDISKLKMPDNIVLADPNFHVPAPIDVLIGADLFWDILDNKQISLGRNNPKLINTRLGWLITGSLNNKPINKYTHCNHASVETNCNNLHNIEVSLSKFWDLEEVPKKSIMSENDRYCENHFIEHTRRNDSGRFIVKLPLKDSPECLGDTYKLAKRRLLSLEKRFSKNSILKIDYTNFILEYEQLGHLSCAKNVHSTNSYYLCHHAVLKQDSESTKLRVVFDGSASSSSGFSLNDILLVGPTVQDSLFAILIRARQYKYLLTGDIEKMYRQVLVAEEDRDLQRILWRSNNSDVVKIFTLNTLTYGTASASYLSTRCLRQIGEEHSDERIKEIIQSDFYVDDLITGANTKEELRYIQNSISSALKKYCFNLRKYKSNHPSIFKHLDINKHDNLTISESSSTLGLGWTPSSDTLYFPIKNCDNSKESITKRFIMSNAFKIFDPLGLLSPVVMQSKILLQEIWKLKLDWDEPVPENIKQEWLEFTNNLPYISNITIPRLVLCNSAAKTELHAFSDASMRAYGACVYIKSISKKGNCVIKLLCAKSKVAPIKATTIPRLELCAALLSAKLCKTVVESIREKPQNITFWCDSSVVLAWINSDPSKLKVFVANRITEVLELSSPKSWRYVPTDLNPADLISRGVNAKRLISMEQWWSGPSFLKHAETEWPILKTKDLIDLPEVKVNTVVVTEPFINFENYSSFTKLQRTFAYIKRFIRNLKNPKNKTIGILTANELRDSFYFLCLKAQQESFSLEYDILLNCKPLPTKSKILSLSPIMDNNQLIRVGGRINSSMYSYEKRHPILLHASHKLTRLYFEKEHISNMHAGPQLLLAIVRESIWPVNGRHLARRVVNCCMRCRRFKGKTLSPKMGDLPPERINPGFPFLSVGIDYAGPFEILNRKGRGSRLIKCYLCLFVCLRYKCLHLEAVSDLTKEAFIMTLKRFIARRGKPSEIFSDNGRNFVAAAKEIGDFLKNNTDSIFDFASQQGITFKFIPSYAAHFGGLWEGGVKSAKFHLRRVMGNSHLTFEEISTLFAQVEAILNSRPLCPLSSSPNDLLPLTPGHFLIGRALTSLPSPFLNEDNKNLEGRYERLNSIRQHFWQRWQREYICELQQRTKWKINKSNLSIGDLVLLHDETTPPLNWRLGRVLRLFPGPDSITRVAEVKTTRGCVRRPLTRLCPLLTQELLKEDFQRAG